VHIRVVLIDDFPLVQEGIAVALGADPAIEVVGRATTAEAGFACVTKCRPDIVLLDLRMPGTSGTALLERLRAAVPEVKVLVMTASEKADRLLQAMRAGAAGYLTKRATQRELIEAVITVHAGGTVVPPQLAGEVLRDYGRAPSNGDAHAVARPLLTVRERDILTMVSRGLTDKEIAAAMFVSPRTVQNGLARIREKTGGGRRAELARWAVEHLAV
jgi:two-component system NarL family response regulator